MCTWGLVSGPTTFSRLSCVPPTSALSWSFVSSVVTFALSLSVEVDD